MGLLVASVGACASDSAAPPEHDYVDGAGVALSVSPQLIAPGEDTEPADRADYRVTAHFDGAGAGVEVELQTWADGGWRAGRTTNTDDRGDASFVAPGDVWARVVAVVDGTTRAAHLYPGRDGAPILFTDEFDASLRAPWTGVGQPREGYSCSRGDDEAAFVTDGVLRLEVKTDPTVSCDLPQPGRANGHVVYDSPLGFGTIAARIRFAAQDDVTGGFWLQPAGASRPWTLAPTEEGVMIASTKGRGRSRARTSVQWLETESGTVRRAVRPVTPDPTADDEFHVYSVDWTPTRYVFRVDGRAVRTATRGVASPPQLMALALLSPDDRRFSGDSRAMDVDWVRVWGQDPLKPAQ
ncbi:glycoside hydrolase family 16 protein [Nocardioides pinisoli]|uniref:Glycoside hydrolase family 16 protein n=1 Tax=Nocardioides pinisoli TaxID=2950279 RepID=A0ABT1KSC8_9ACTN|nr:glycoside hydrolase family 16 protein [Nocardioides pinisoli]MCP3420648.1 glycoside hydrolase family 16 protein [Nocardioides pinisoli]